MIREAVESSNVVSIGYDPTHKVVEVEFKGGRVYHYTDISPAEWEARSESESIGRWVRNSLVAPALDTDRAVRGEFEAPDDETGEDAPAEDTDGEEE